VTARPPCPEALYGIHGEPNTSGNCPYCGLYLGRPRLASRWEPDLDDWSDPETLDRDPDDDTDGIAVRLITEHYGPASAIAWHSMVPTRGRVS
jgi:hypothetical protein